MFGQKDTVSCANCGWEGRYGELLTPSEQPIGDVHYPDYEGIDFSAPEQSLHCPRCGEPIDPPPHEVFDMDKEDYEDNI
jgi:hypothetical protein